MRRALALALLLAASTASAHPHVFADATVEVRFGARGLEGVRFAWAHDEFTSALIQQTYDRAATGRFSPAAMREIEAKEMDPLRSFGYFVSVAVNGAAVPVTAIREFAVEAVKGRVTYLFTVPVPPPAAPSGTITINVDDPSWYMAFALVEPVRVQAPPAYEVACRLARDEQTNRPEGIKCSYRRRAP
jgi:ABC-type uncharacterized transport system substrate-binding protein